MAFAILLSLPGPQELSPEGWRTAAVGVLMAVWWITEAIPIPATALLPLVLFPLVGGGDIDAAARPYANPLIGLFLGGFLIAIAMQRWGLHRRIALAIIETVGTSPPRLVGGFMLASALLSMGVSNTATALMMLPIGLSVVALARDAEGNLPPAAAPFGIALMLAIAYGCNIGGLGTLIGTPPNTLMAGFLGETYGVDVGFAQWLLLGLPLVVVGLPLAYLLLVRWIFPLGSDSLLGGGDVIRQERAKLGPMRRPEIIVAGVFATVAALWMTRPLLEGLVPGLSDAGVAMTGGLALFLIPLDLRKGDFVLDWTSAKELPWDILILFGGGLSLAGAVQETGLAAWIGESLGWVELLPLLGIMVVVALVIVMLTEVTSNTATAATFLPIMAAVALGIGQNPFFLLVPVALAASSAFMLPVATPPNAIVFGSRLLTIPQMARAGVYLNLLFVLLIAAMAYILVPLVFGAEHGVVPDWTNDP